MYMYIKLSFEGKKEGESLRNIYNRKHVYEQIELFMCLGVNLHWCVWVLACQWVLIGYFIWTFHPYRLFFHQLRY